MINKNIMQEAHKLTKDIKAEFPEVDYKAQLGICIKFLLEKEKEKPVSSNIVAVKLGKSGIKQFGLIEESINKCVKRMKQELPNIDFSQLKFEIKDMIGSDRYIMGRYTYKTKIVELKADKSFMKKIEHTIYHEIAHFLHKEMFDLKTVRLSTEHKSWYAGKDSRENFAEAVADYFSGRFDKFKEEPKRNIQIKKALGII